MRKLISWVEIPATDIERAAKFYSKVLNLEIQVMDFGKEKMACFPNGELYANRKRTHPKNYPKSTI